MVRNHIRNGLVAAAAFALAGGAWTGASRAEELNTTGPFKVVMEEDASLPNHTVYRPADLAAVGPEALPIVVWGNGACANVGNAFSNYLAEIASHGFLVIANGPIDPKAFGRPLKPGEPFPPLPAGGLPPPNSSPSQMIDAITWAQAQADAPGGAYKGRIAKTRVAVAGQSCGGLQALIAAADPRVTTAIIMNSGVLRRPPNLPTPTGAPAGPMPQMPKPDLTRLHTPMLYVIGGPKDIAYDNANGDFDEIDKLPVFRVDLDVGHGGTFWDPHGGRFAEIASVWLEWRLKGDASAGRDFTGPDCGYCHAPELTVRTKNMGSIDRP